MLMTGLAACPCAARGGVRDRSTLTLEPASAKHVPVPVVVWQEPFTVEARIFGDPVHLVYRSGPGGRCRSIAPCRGATGRYSQPRSDTARSA
jgi:hypothetical protein